MVSWYTETAQSIFHLLLYFHNTPEDPLESKCANFSCFQKHRQLVTSSLPVLLYSLLTLGRITNNYHNNYIYYSNADLLWNSSGNMSYIQK